MKIVLIGSGGGVARRILPILRRDYPNAVFLGVDLSDNNPGLDYFFHLDLISILDPNFDSAFFDDIFVDADVVIMLAAAVHKKYRDKEIYQKLNIEVPITLYDMMRKVGRANSKFIFTSSISVYGDNPTDADEFCECTAATDYARSKLEAEVLLSSRSSLASSPALTILRLATIINRYDQGNLPRLVSFLAKSGISVKVSPGIRKSFIDVEDVGRVISLVVRQEGYQRELFNVSAPPIDLSEIFDLIAFMQKGSFSILVPHWILRIVAPTLSHSVSIAATKIKRQLNVDFQPFEKAFLREFGI